MANVTIRKAIKNRIVNWIDPDVYEAKERFSSESIVAGGTETRGGIGNAITRLVKRMPGYGFEHNLQLYMYFILKEALPIINSAMTKRRYIEGPLRIESQDTGLLRDIKEFVNTVPIGRVDNEAQVFRGLDVAQNAQAINADTYGLGVMEPVLSEDKAEIERILLPNPRTFNYRKEQGENRYSLWQTVDGIPTKITSPNVKLLGFEYNTEGVWPLPMAWGLPFISEVLVRMIVSLNNLWWRTGDPSQLYTINYHPESTVTNGEMDRDADVLEQTIVSILKNRRVGKVSDGVLAFKGGTMEQTTVGGNSSHGLAQFFQTHYNVIAGQIIGRSDTPAWLYPEVETEGEGMGSSRSELQANMAVSGATRRNVPKLTNVKDIIDLFLIVTKGARFLGRYSIYFETAQLRDEKVFEETRNSREQANKGAIENAQRLLDLEMIDGEDKRADYLVRSGVLPKESE